MFTRALPILIINLGGEMMYILDQRLSAQKICYEKSIKVLYDVVSTLFSKQFVDEIFKPQELYPRKSLRLLFEKIAHSSIMRLNTTSMDKLFDLMLMVFKYQVALCPSPSDLLYISMNHLGALYGYVQDCPQVAQQVAYVHSLFLKNYSTLSLSQLQQLRYILLSFFQDIQIRVSVFLKDGTQLNNGRFVIPSDGPVPVGTHIPGVVRIYKDGAVIAEERFNAGLLYESASSENSLELQGTRSLVLGTNIYKNLKEPMVKEETPASKECPVPEQVSSLEAFPPPQSAQSGGDARAAQELQLLAELIGCKPAPPGEAFTLQLFSPETESAEVAEGNKDPEESIFTIDASKGARLTNYEDILQDLTLEPSSQSQDEDLLELMDKA